MRKSFARQLGAPVVCTVFLIGCGGGDEPRPQRPITTAAEDPAGQVGRDASDEHLAVGVTVALSGCIQGAPGTDAYVLRNVRVETREGIDPHRDTTTPGPHGITEGSWVRLDGGERAEELQSFLGHRVTLTGDITDTGESVIGTAGTTGDQTAAGATTRAAGDEHYAERIKDEAGRIARQSLADGTAALVRVTAVESTSDRCPIDLRPEAR